MLNKEVCFRCREIASEQKILRSLDFKGEFEKEWRKGRVWCHKKWSDFNEVTGYVKIEGEELPEGCDYILEHVV